MTTPRPGAMDRSDIERAPVGDPAQGVEPGKREARRPLRTLRWFRRAAWLAVLVLLAAASAYAGWRMLAPASPPTARQMGQALVRSEFELVDHHGDSVTAKDFAGRWQLVFFGYTYCPDVCPTTLATIAEALDALGDDVDRVAPLFITVDPARDTPDVLAEYMAAFHPGLVGLTGTPAQVEAAAKSFRVYHARAEEADAPDGYLMAHSGYIYLMTPDGEYEAVFTEKRHSPEEIAAAIMKRLGNS